MATASAGFNVQVVDLTDVLGNAACWQKYTRVYMRVGVHGTRFFSGQRYAVLLFFDATCTCTYA